MVGPIRFDGLASGLDYTSIIGRLLQIARRPAEKFEQRLLGLTEKKTALLTVSANLLAFKSTADTLSRPSFLNRTKAVSSNENVLAASGEQIATTGTFTFRVARLAQAHLLLSSGYASTSTAVTSSASTVRVEVGNGFVDRETPISLLRGAEGIDRGLIQVTDTANNTAVIDLQAVTTVGEVIDTINQTTGVNVRASLSADRIVIEDLAGGLGTLSISNFGLFDTATDLGISGTGVLVGGSQFLFGQDINFLAGTTPLRVLNDGLGVRQEAGDDFTITAGVTFSVEISSTAATIQDAINAINNATGNPGVTASLTPDRTAIRLASTAGAISVAPVGTSLAAVDLGLGRVSGTTFVQTSALNATTGAVGGTQDLLLGTRLLPSLRSTLRNTLNGGQVSTSATDIQGVREGSILITDRTGASTTVNLSRYPGTTLAVAAGGSATSVTVAAGAGVLFTPGNKIRIVGDGAVAQRTVTQVAGDVVSFDRPLTAAFGLGRAVYAVNESVADLVRAINYRAQQAGVGVRARVSNSGNGLRVEDLTAGTGSMSVAGVGGAFTAADLGIAGSTAQSVLEGGDLDPQYIGANTLLSTLNQGRGMMGGTIRITDRAGTVFDVPLTSSSLTTIGQVTREINTRAAAAGSSVTARVNDTGDGLLLRDPGGGTGLLRVAEIGSTTTARDLNLAGTASSSTPDRIDGAYEYVIDIKAGATVDDVVKALSSSRAPIRALALNDGDPINPIKISLASRITGQAGRLIVTPGFSGLGFATSTPATDATLLFGSDAGLSTPTVIQSSSNVITTAVSGLRLELRSPSASNVTVSVSRDTEGVVDQFRRFAETHNTAVKLIREVTKFDPDKPKDKGVLFSEGVIRRIRRDLGNLLTLPVEAIPSGDLRSLRELGVNVSDDGLVTVDETKLTSALESNFDQVETLLTMQRKLDVGTPLADFHRGLGVREVSGNDFRVIKRSGDYFDVDLSGAETAGQALQRINLATGNGGQITAQIHPDGFQLQLVDNSLATGRTAEGGSATTVVESQLVSSPISFAGARITFTSGANNGVVRNVSSFDASTGTFTLDSAVAPVGAGDTFVLERPLEVKALNSSTAASDLGIRSAAELGEDSLDGTLILLEGAPGAMFRIGDRLDEITRPDDGMISTRAEGLDDSMKGVRKSIDRIDERLRRMEERLIREFARLEQLLAESTATMSRLQAMQGALSSGGLSLLQLRSR